MQSMDIPYYSLVLAAVTVCAGIVQVDVDRPAANCSAEWVDGGTSDGLSQVECLLGKSFHKGYTN